MTASKSVARTVLSTALAIALTLLGGQTQAQATFPDRPIRLIVPFPPGGGADNDARAVFPKVAQIIGQSIIIENKPGAGGNVGSEMVARAVPDGYTILYGTNGTHGINQALYAKTGFDPIKDFTPITRFSMVPAMLVVNPSLPVNSVRELVAYLKANPGKMSFASAGNGTTSHLAGTLFKNMTGVDIVHVPYRGGGAALVGLMGGEVQIMIDLMVNLLPQVKAGKLKGLAVTTLSRLPTVPDLPTLDEAGVTGFDITANGGIYAPPGTPRAIVAKLNAALQQALNDPEVRASMAARGSFPVPGTPEELAQHVARELPMWAKLVRESGTKID